METISWKRICHELDCVTATSSDRRIVYVALYLATYIRDTADRIPNYRTARTDPITVDQLQTLISVALLHLQYSMDDNSVLLRKKLRDAGIMHEEPPRPLPACPISPLTKSSMMIRTVQWCCNRISVRGLGAHVRQYFQDQALLRACQLLVRVDFRSRIIEGTLQSTKGPITIETTRISTDVDVPYIEIKLCIDEQHVVFVFKKGDEWGHSVKITSVHGTEDELCSLIRFVCTHKLKIQPAT